MNPGRSLQIISELGSWSAEYGVSGRARISPALIEKTLKAPATGRNWNTVTKLLSIAAGLEAGRR
jgi:hypothetical protein